MKQSLLFSFLALLFILSNSEPSYAKLYALSQNGNCELIAQDGIPYIDKTCSLCLGYFDEEDEVISTHCNHLFHANCFKNYYKCHRHHTACSVCKQTLKPLIEAVNKEQEFHENQIPEAQASQLDGTASCKRKTSPLTKSLPYSSFIRGQTALEKYKKLKDEPATEQAINAHLHNALFQLKFAYQYGQQDNVREQAQPLLVEAFQYKAEESYKHLLEEDDPFNYHRDLSEILFTFILKPKPRSRPLTLPKSLTLGNTDITVDEAASPSSISDKKEDASCEPKLARIQWMIGEETFQLYKDKKNQNQLKRAQNYFEQAARNADKADQPCRKKYHNHWLQPHMSGGK